MAIFRKKKQPPEPVEKAATENGDQEKKVDDADSKGEDTSSPEKVPPVSYTQLFRYSTKLELFLDFIGLICAVASGAAQPLMTLLFGNLAESFVNFATALQSNDPAALATSRSEFRRIAARDATWLTVMGVGLYAVIHAYQLIWTYTGEVNAKRIREKYLASVLRQDIAYFDKVGAGEVTSRVQNDTNLIQQGISEKFPLIISFLSAFLTGFALAYGRSWRLALVLSSILPALTIAGAVLTKLESKYKELALTETASGSSLAEEVLSTVRTAQAFGSQKTLSSLYDGFTIRAYLLEVKMAIWRGIGTGVMTFIVYASYALAFWFGTTLLLEGKADAGLVVNVFLSIVIGAFSLTQMAPESQAVGAALAAAAKLFATIDRVPPIDSADEGGLKPDKVVGRITFDNVVFNYPSRPDVPILKGLNLDISAGSSIALVGASGTGKSTVVSLVERFYDPLSGAVKLDGVDIKELNIKWLRQQIGLVQQEPVLFSTSIRNNVSYGFVGSPFENASPEEKFRLVQEACVKANADAFIRKLPEGYDTIVGERGVLLSGGQKQRIAIARAIVSDPRILLLDEATSALDTQSEGVVQDALDKAAAGRTTITIAHRLSTIRDADQIYVIGDGTVLEHGTHNELLSNQDGPYAQLVSAQKLKGEEGLDDSNVKTRVAGGLVTKQEIEQIVAEEVPDLQEGRGTRKSLASDTWKSGPEKPEQEQEHTTHSLFYLLKRMALIDREDWTLYAVGVVAATVGCIAYPAFGIVFGKALETFSLTDRHAVRHGGDRNALWMFVVAIGASFTTAAGYACFGRAAAGLQQKLKSSIFRAMLRQNVGWFDEEKHATGSLISELSQHPEKISVLAGMTLTVIIQCVAMAIGGTIIGLAFAPKLGAVSFALIPVSFLIGYVRLHIVVLKDQANKSAYNYSAQLACEAAAAVKTVQSLTREKDSCDEYSRSLGVPLARSNRTAIISTGLYGISQATSFFAIALAFWYGSILISDLVYTPGNFFVCLMAVTLGATQAGQVFLFVPDIASARVSMESVIKLLDRVPDIDSESPEGTKVDPKSVQGQIRFEDVRFSYPTRRGVQVLRKLNLSVEPGTYVALVGMSGCGKSTVVQLIERFYDPTSGKVLLDGADISTLNIQDYRKNIALVSQEPNLYAGTIRFNILLGSAKPTSEITQEELEQVCRDANILEFIQSLPQGFETEVGGKGSQLSGGQKQRIAIARALLRNPKVLLLDEATSALDSQSEKVVQAALDNAAKGRTTIAIAHRLSTIQNADRIYFIKEGRVAEVGTHQELLAKRGGYYELVRLQELSAF
ncbi:GTPase-activating protein [Tulasnella sp. UAMH 9824]|nr:GTPase-activating protein [Tulasnella sp. UAMH 9824]